MFEVYFLTKSLTDAPFVKKSQNRALDVSSENLVLEIENTYLKPLFKRISILKKNELGVEILIFGIFMPFLHMLLRSNHALFVDFAVLD